MLAIIPKIQLLKATKIILLLNQNLHFSYFLSKKEKKVFSFFITINNINGNLITSNDFGFSQVFAVQKIISFFLSAHVASAIPFIGDNISIESANVKININDICNLIGVSSERFN